ncbi:hypothetical protein [Leptospira fluminis]|uniref:hypothetical protein n=1 Tax=Leptospira fluminis TaxID=2484979 RepID=UPI00143BD546|nr:hypothetical protein [Leptospira fluminis]
MRVESSPFDAVSSFPPVSQPGAEPPMEKTDGKEEEKTPNSDYVYALSTGGIINVQV